MIGSTTVRCRGLQQSTRVITLLTLDSRAWDRFKRTNNKKMSPSKQHAKMFWLWLRVLAPIIGGRYVCMYTWCICIFLLHIYACKSLLRYKQPAKSIGREKVARPIVLVTVGSFAEYLPRSWGRTVWLATWIVSSVPDAISGEACAGVFCFWECVSDLFG